MTQLNQREASICSASNILVAFSPRKTAWPVNDFFGSVIEVADSSMEDVNFDQKTVYLCGDISKSKSSIAAKKLEAASQVLIVRELSSGFENIDAWPIVNLGLVPVRVEGMGVFYPRYFDKDVDYFKQICSEHAFQSLTESNKPGTAHRTGIYLTQVEAKGEDRHFRLLRCSTNLSGPTDNFRATDTQIVSALNQQAAGIFQNHAPLNHVLAQVYHNTAATDAQKQTKAKISSHADKTKDMPENGIMAFCTFYDELEKLQPIGDFDYGVKKTSGLTRLIFRLKKQVAERPQCDLPTQFTVTLYPNSVFFMPLSTNRLYTHEIRSSALDADKLPTRLGYVVRCSNTEAVHTDGETFINKQGDLTKLEQPTPDGMSELRTVYASENKTDDFIDYGDRFLFSMNTGDYTAPNYNVTDEFRTYSMNMDGNLFDELMDSVNFEDLGKGRKGTVLLNPDPSLGHPIVRTTSKFDGASHCFGSVHKRLANQIQNRASLPLALNNALIETYSNEYFKMGFHSDMALDLAERSFIALFSCYKDPELANPPRMLVIEPKESPGETVEIPLADRSVVVFSLSANSRFKHKITLDRSANPPENQWLGVTFRTSKTWVNFQDKQPFFADGTPLSLADEEEARKYYALRGRENKELDFTYPELRYTISQSDREIPVRLNG